MKLPALASLTPIADRRFRSPLAPRLLRSWLSRLLLLTTLLLVAAAPLAAKDYRARIVGKWATLSMTDGEDTRQIPQGKSLTWDFQEDGTLLVVMSDDKGGTNRTTWKIRGETILIGNTNAQPDVIQFAFYDDLLILSRHPDDNFVLQRQDE